MADGTTKIGNGNGTNGVNGNGVDPQMWRDVHHAMETQAIPSLGLLRQLRSLLFKEDPDRNRSTSIAKLLGGTQGPALDEEAAWGVLQEWMEELEIDIEEIHARAELTSDELTFEPVEGTGEVEHQEEAVVGDAFEAAPDEGVAQTTPAVSSDLAALQRSAQRFADVDRIKPIQTSFDSVAEKIESRISLWGARYGEVSEYHKEEIDERLETLKRNFGEATSHDDMQYAEDLKDALKILWNRILRIEREMFATELKSVNPFKVSLFSYKDEISKSKIQDPRSKIVSTTRTVTRAREKEGTRIAALVSKHKSGMAIDLRDHQWDMMKAIQLDWGSHEDAIRRGGRRDLWRSSVIVAPTGSGKTRVMASSIELGIREGWLRFDKSDKVFIETHLKEIKTQNVNSMQQLLNPVFREIYGRDVRITVISGESKTWDVSGDVVVVSVPTIGRKAGDQKLIAELNGSVTNALILQDEYHHAAAASWQRTTDAIMHACGRGYVMGFTATLPLSERAGSNIIYENTARNLMNKLVLPAMELVQVRTGVDLQRIPTVGGDFNLRELSQTVRNLERYEHTMRALEFNGVRNGKGGMASTLIFTVDTLHAEETAAYYQMYFAKQRENYDLIPGEVVEALPKRNIAVINGRMKETEIDKLIAARRYNSEAEYDIYSHDGGFITSGRNRAKIDGMVAVITGNTPTHIRKKLINASRAGLVECLINIKVFGEGFDGWWIQNLVGARPALVSANTKMIQRAQEIGRIMRYGPDEIDKSGLLKRAPRRRVAIDLIDNTSVRRPLVTYLDVLGISSELEREFGKKIDVASDGISGNAYGGLKDIYDTSGEGTPRKRELDLPETIEMRNVFGEREHWLYPEEYVGPLAQELRRIWGIKYHGNLKELAADLAVSEEMLVGYFNMSVPADDRVIKRMATFLYKGRMDLMAAFINEFQDWKPLESIEDPDIRELVRIAREKVITVFGGRLPWAPFETVDGWRSMWNLDTSKPFNDFLSSGTLTDNAAKSMSVLWRDLRLILFNVELTEDGKVRHIPENKEVEDIIYRIIAKENKWIPLEKIEDPDLRRLIEIARAKFAKIFSGKYPRQGFQTTDKWKSAGRRILGDIEHFLKTAQSATYPDDIPAGFWFNLSYNLLNLDLSLDRKLKHVDPDPEVQELLHKIIIRNQTWVPLDEIEDEDVRELTGILRDKEVSVFHGWVSKHYTVDGEQGSRSHNRRINEIVQSGVFEFMRGKKAALYWEMIKRDLLGLKRTLDGGLIRVPIEPRAAELIERIIARNENWVPLDKIEDEDVREIVRFARRKLLDVHSGSLPNDRMESIKGYLSSTFPLNKLPAKLVKSGDFSSLINNQFRQFWTDLRFHMLYIQKAVGKEGLYDHSLWNNEIEEKILRVIYKQQNWVPLEKIKDEGVRNLVDYARRRMSRVFGGQFSEQGFETADGWVSGHIPKAIRDLVQYGYLPSIEKMDAEFMENLRKMVLYVDLNLKAEVVHTGPNPHVEDLIYKVVRDKEGWMNPSQIEDPDLRILAEYAGRKFVRNFDTSHSTARSEIRTKSGEKISLLNLGAITRLLTRGDIWYEMFWPTYKDLIIDLERTGDNEYDFVPAMNRSELIAYVATEVGAKLLTGNIVNIDYADLKARYEKYRVQRVFARFVARDKGWTPLDDIGDARVRELLHVAREQVVDVYGGQLPGFGLNGKYFKKTFFAHFIKTGEIYYSEQNDPEEFFKDLVENFLTARYVRGGKPKQASLAESARQVELEPRLLKLVEELRAEGAVAFAARGAAKRIKHPTKKTDPDDDPGSGGSAPPSGSAPNGSPILTVVRDDGSSQMTGFVDLSALDEYVDGQYADDDDEVVVGNTGTEVPTVHGAQIMSQPSVGVNGAPAIVPAAGMLFLNP